MVRRHFDNILVFPIAAHLAKPELRSVELGNFISECLIKDMEKRPFAKQLIRHPYFTKIASRIDVIRKELKQEIQRQINEGVLRRQAEVTTKHGKLKSDRKSKPQKMYMDDLGEILSNLSAEFIELLKNNHICCFHLIF